MEPETPTPSDPRNSLQHLLSNDPVDSATPDTAAADADDTVVTVAAPASAPTAAAAAEASQLTTTPNSSTQMDASQQEASADDAAAGTGAAATPSGKQSSSKEPEAMYTSTTTTTRRNANGSVSSVYSGNKMRHLKKDDGIPLWRKDIQYDFLRFVFEDEHKVFHKMSDGTSGHTFADIYLDAMAKSSKCSKILKDKLLTERPAALNMAMVCLLVNMGRMNTTLNFFPEMRAQLRTYHSIPSLQAHQDPNAYKQLQDAPRLKSILKGATEDTEQPSTIEDISNAAIPRTNPVNLIFVLAHFAPKISEIHFFPPRDFFDLVMRSSLSSRSRATSFLWLMWWYLESDFSKQAALDNPFGAGQYGTDGDATKGMPIKCPPFKHLTEEEVAQENVDTEEEKAFGELKRKERLTILQSDSPPVVTGPKRNTKKVFNNNPVFSVIADDGGGTPTRDGQSPLAGGRGRNRTTPHSKVLADNLSDTDRTRSASPPGVRATPHMRINTLLNEEAPSASSTPAKGPGRGNWSRSRLSTGGRGSRKSEIHASQVSSLKSNRLSSHSRGPHGFYLPLNGLDPTHKRSRPLTAHQAAVERYRRERVDFILDRKLRESYVVSKKRRERHGAIGRAWLRCKYLPLDYDTDDDLIVGDDDHRPPSFAGLADLEQYLPSEKAEDDFGEEAYMRAQMMRRVARRIDRWEGGGVRAVKRKKKDGSGEEITWISTSAENGVLPGPEGEDGERFEGGDEELDDADRELLAEVDADDTDEEVDEDQEMVGA